MKENKLVEVVIKKPNINFYLLVLLTFVFITPFLHDFGKTILLLIYNIPVSRFKISPLFGNPYFSIAFPDFIKLTPIQIYLLWAIDPLLLIFYGLLSLYFKNIWYKIFGLATLFNACYTISLYLTNNIFELCGIISCSFILYQYWFSIVFFLHLIFSLALIIKIILDLTEINLFQEKELNISQVREKASKDLFNQSYFFNYKKKIIELKS